MAIDSSVSVPQSWPRRHPGKLVLVAVIALFVIFGARRTLCLLRCTSGRQRWRLASGRTS
jgi:hypothetical protein